MTDDSDVVPATTQPAPNISTERPRGDDHSAFLPPGSIAANRLKRMAAGGVR